MRRLKITEPASLDLEEIHDYIAADHPAAAARWLEKLREQCRRLAEVPGMGRIREDLAPGLRSFPSGSYLIIYQEIEGGIEVVRVIHGARQLDDLFS
jgi:toxin ParE1/3/4